MKQQNKELVKNERSEVFLQLSYVRTSQTSRIVRQCEEPHQLLVAYSGRGWCALAATSIDQTSNQYYADCGYDCQQHGIEDESWPMDAHVRIGKVGRDRMWRTKF